MQHAPKCEYTVEFRIEGATLVPDRITDILGLQPSLVRLAGDRRGTGRDFDKALWAFSGDPLPSGEARTWKALDDGLRYVAAQLAPRSAALRGLLREFDGYWWCAHFETGLVGETRMSPDVMLALADIGAPLLLAAYFGSLVSE